jgi:hypothetical protein
VSKRQRLERYWFHQSQNAWDCSFPGVSRGEDVVILRHRATFSPLVLPHDELRNRIGSIVALTNVEPREISPSRHERGIRVRSRECISGTLCVDVCFIGDRGRAACQSIADDCFGAWQSVERIAVLMPQCQRPEWAARRISAAGSPAFSGGRSLGDIRPLPWFTSRRTFVAAPI